MNKYNMADKNLQQEMNFKSEDLGKFKLKQNDLDAELNNVIKESTEVN